MIIKMVRGLFLIYSLFMMLINGAVDFPPKEERPNIYMNNCNLFVNGTDISTENYVYLNCEDHYAKLPLTAIMKALGATVQWKNETIAQITYNGTSYILDTSKNTLVEKDKSFDFIELPPGTSHGFAQMIGNEFVLDSISIREFLTSIGATINIDYENSIIYIYTD